MAASEDQPQPVSLDLHVIGLAERSGGWLEGGGARRERGIETDTTAHGIDGFEAACRHEPGSGMRWHPIPRPLLHCRREGFVQSFFSQVEVAQQSDKGGKNPARLRAVDVIHNLT